MSEQEQENEEELKAEFARLLLQTPDDPFKAALALFPENTNRALRVANEWPRDLAVVEARKELVEDEGEDAFLPGKAHLARSIWDRMHKETTDTENFAKLGKLYADVRGFIEKPQTNIQNNIQNTTNKVMVIRESSTSDEWETNLRKQQDRLTNDATCH